MIMSLIRDVRLIYDPCDYCVSPVQRIGFLGLGFWVWVQTWSDLRIRIWGLLGQGIGTLDSGLTIFVASCINVMLCIAYFWKKCVPVIDKFSG